jgi:hypothetical protein
MKELKHETIVHISQHSVIMRRRHHPVTLWFIIASKRR